MTTKQLPSLETAIPAPAPSCIAQGEGEGDRLAALQNLRILDTPSEEAFDTITRLAAKAMQVPILLVSLVDESRQWFKSRVGLDATQTPREISFCTHAVRERKPLVVCDATQDPSFSCNPLVVNEPRIRAYLGVPIYTRAGHAIGTLCAIDRRPRDFGAEDIQTMRDFARLVERELQARELSQETERALKVAAEQERLFRETFEQAAVGIAHISLAGHVYRINDRLCQMLGYTSEELATAAFVDITHPEDLERDVEQFRRMIEGRLDRYRMEKRYLCKNGQYLWTLVSASLVRSASGEPNYIVGVMEDISQVKLVEEELMRTRDSLQQELQFRTQRLEQNNTTLRAQIKRALESERVSREAKTRLRAIANSVPAMIGYWNAELRCEFCNEAYREWFGIEPHRIVGMKMADVLDEPLFCLNEPYARRALAGREQRFEREMIKVDGSRAYIDVRYTSDVDEAGVVRGFFVLATDITSLRETQLALEAANAQLRNESVTDYLTGLSNRRVFSERSEEALRLLKASGETYGLILLDLDDFKRINDEFGHAAGDDVLRAVGRILRNSLRGLRDVAARLGGEEFAVLCFGDLNEESLRQIGERIRAAIGAERLQTSRGALQFTGSLGIALSHIEDADWKNIYARADAALYEAKTSGKDRVILGRSYVTGATTRLRSLGVP